MFTDGLALKLLARHYHHNHYHFKSPLAKVFMVLAGIIIIVPSVILKRPGDPKDKNLKQRAIFAGIGIVFMILAVIIEMLYLN